jgi:methyl-accepting chemotaxis protein
MLRTYENISLFNLGTIELSLERSVSQVALNVSSPISLSFRSMLSTQRSLGTPKIEDVISNLTTDGKVKEALKVKSYLNELNDVRTIVDRNTSVNIEQRDMEFVKEFPFVFPNILEEIRAVKYSLRHEEINIPSSIQNLESISNYSWEIREFGGRERTYFAIALYNKSPITPEIKERMAMLNKRVEYAWKKILSLKNDPNLDKNILEEINSLEKGYFMDYGKLRERLIEESKSGNYSMGFAEYFEKSSAALALSENLCKSSTNKILEMVEHEKNLSLFLLIFIALFTILALGMCNYFLKFINKEVIENIIKVSSILNSLSKGNKNIDFNDMENHKNEIGSMIQSSKIFRDSLLRLDKLIAEQSSAVSETTQVVEMLDKSSKHSSEQANQVSAISQMVLQAATEGEEMVNQVKGLQMDIQEKVITINDYIKILESQTNQIETITDVVSELAKQTNMLALNAAVEASRAGEFGRGFAVVSVEIRKLSDESKSSATKIQGLIDEIKKSVKNTAALTEMGKRIAIEGSSFADETSIKFKQVAGSIGKLSDNVSSIAINLNQQVKAHEEVLLAMNSLNDKTKKLLVNSY